MCFAIMSNLGFNPTYCAWFEIIIIFLIIWLIDEKDLQSLLHHSSARRRIKNRDNREGVHKASVAKIFAKYLSIICWQRKLSNQNQNVILILP